ncbi:hypothetical protein [Pimelobacter simplex]|uniref:hypothetical protein n=1 Tax=Nocardioides simplex TaxID=2045 RepID=UPI0021505387|nr:hypothetical protein [Pimelobacter simplex]UUW91829.1 hypothetical protein M0M43_10195 [Pimelobacter simplex]UUW95657.1 hypothetical protein M0M48_28695 [Pimelobacter simplex]
MDYLAASTDAATFEMVPCDTSSTAGQTDVVWRGQPSRSAAESRRRFDNGLCDRHRQYRKTACHELGHTLGLNHFNAPHESCQRLGWTGTITDAWTRTWTAHHRGHIDDWF